MFCNVDVQQLHFDHFEFVICCSVDDQAVTLGNSVLMSILLTAEKRKCLPYSIISKLIDLLGKSFGNLIVLILSRCDQLVIDDVIQLELISDKLSSEQVAVQKENAMVTFEEPCDPNDSSGFSVALLAAQLLLKAVEYPMTVKEVSEKTFQNLLTATDICKDKQARQVAIKCVYLLSVMPNQSSCYFVWDVLNSLQSLAKNEVYLISTYAHAAYVRRLAVRATLETEPLTADFMDSLSSMFVSQDSMKIGEKDFVLEINKDVLDILACETRKGHEFQEDDLFLIMEEVIYGNKRLEFTVKVF